MRQDGRRPDQLRPLAFKRRYTRNAAGSVLVQMGRTTVLCTCCVDLGVPPFLVGTGKGWLSAEYSMLPGSTQHAQGPRSRRQDRRPQRRDPAPHRPQPARRRRPDPARRNTPCGSTATSSTPTAAPAPRPSTGPTLPSSTPCKRGKISLAAPKASSAAAWPPSASALLGEEELLDLDYIEDKDVDVDLNLVMTGAGEFIEVQGSGEEATFSRSQLDRLLKLGKLGIDAVTALQRKTLGTLWPVD